MTANWFAQIFIITWMNLRNIPRRWGSSLVAVFGMACVVGVFVSVLSMATGFQRTMANAAAREMGIAGQRSQPPRGQLDSSD